MSILILEDNIIFARIVQRCLESNGYSDISIAESSEEALDLLDINTFDILLVDWMLPGMDGLDFVRRLRETESYEDLPIIMMTSKDQAQDVQEAAQAGIDGYILKPERGWGAEPCNLLIQRIQELTDEEEAPSDQESRADASHNTAKITRKGDLVELLVPASNTERKNVIDYVDTFLPDTNRSTIEELVETNDVLVNGDPVDASYAVGPEDRIICRLRTVESAEQSSAD